MEIKRFEIASGVSLNVADTDKYKTNVLWLTFVAPLDRSTASLNTLIPSVLTRGSQKYRNMRAISTALDNLYASTISPTSVKRAETQFFGFTATMLDNSYALDGCDISSGVVDILDDIIFRPATVNGSFDPSFVNGEKDVLCDYIASEINNKGHYAAVRCIEEMCKNEAFSVSSSGKVEDVAAVDPEILWDHYNKILGDCCVEAFYVGRFTDAISKKIVAVLEKFGSSNTVDYTPQIVKRADAIKRIVEDQPVKQAKLSMGFRTGMTLRDKDFYKFTVFNSVFGASQISKLFMNVREKMSLAYYCSSSVDALKGVMLVNSGVDVANAEKAEREVMNQLSEIAAGNITDDELNYAKEYILNSYRELEDSPSGIYRWYTARMLAGRNDSPAENAERILSVTKRDLAEVATKITLDTVYLMNPVGGAEEASDE